jgi:predicted aldo/keto reductase-like oxidoreductase
MRYTQLGKTGLSVSRASLGCLPIQRVSREEAARLLRRAFDSGVNFFDTARAYTDSEEKVAYAFEGMRREVFIATKSMAAKADKLWEDLYLSLKTLKTDYIDVYQLHNPPYVPQPGGEDGLYDALVEAKKQGLIRHIGLSNHAQNVSETAVCSGLYETLQYPFSCLASGEDESIVKLCKDNGVGFIAMKGMSGGLIRNVRANYSYISSFENAVPIWGVQREGELDEFLALENEAPPYDETMKAQVKKEREELQGNFCRGCGYCMPCPAGIQISTAARMDMLLLRAVPESFTTPEWRENMERITECLMCGQCEQKCPYHLKTYDILKKQLGFYREFCSKN